MNTHTDTIPWYRQPLVWMIISIPLSAIAVCSVLLYLAITTDDGLVADDYYKQGLAINRQIERTENAVQLKLTATINIDTDSGYVKVKFKKGIIKEYPSQLQLALKHATQYQKDHFLILLHGIDDQYVGSITSKRDKALHEGIWHVELSNIVNEGDVSWRLVKRARLKGLSAVSLIAQ